MNKRKGLLAILRGAVIAVCVLAAAREVSANDVREYPLEKKVHLSDLVFIGHVVSVRRDNGKNIGREYAHVRIDTVLKGAARDYVDVVSKGGIAEDDPQCSEVGKGYLFLVIRWRDTFESVNGPFGVYPLQ